MRYAMPVRRALLCLALSPAMLAFSCDRQAVTSASYPPANQVRVEPKPLPTDGIVTDPAAYALYQSAIEAWGERGWSAVGRICRDAVRRGAAYPDGWCPEAAD